MFEPEDAIEDSEVFDEFKLTVADEEGEGENNDEEEEEEAEEWLLDGKGCVEGGSFSIFRSSRQIFFMSISLERIHAKRKVSLSEEDVTVVWWW